MTAKKTFYRREFIGTAAAASVAFTILPWHVLGGPVEGKKKSRI